VKFSVPLPGDTSCSWAEGRPLISTCSGLASRLDRAESACIKAGAQAILVDAVTLTLSWLAAVT